MSVFPPVSGPRALWADLKLFWSTRTRVQWIAGTLAALIPLGFGVAFWLDGKTNISPGAQMIMVESWSANRTDAEIRARQQHDSALRNEREAARRADFGAMDNALNRAGF